MWTRADLKRNAKICAQKKLLEVSDCESDFPFYYWIRCSQYRKRGI